MSPARSKRQAVLPHKRDRTDIFRAIGVAAAIVVVTAILVWLLRPGPPGVPATGGLMNRQPRASWLVGIVIGLGALAATATLTALPAIASADSSGVPRWPTIAVSANR